MIWLTPDATCQMMWPPERDCAESQSQQVHYGCTGGMFECASSLEHCCGWSATQPRPVGSRSIPFFDLKQETIYHHRL
jgi:hypothetical protein